MAGVSPGNILDPGNIPDPDSSLETNEVLGIHNHICSPQDFIDPEITFNMAEKRLKSIKTKQPCILKHLDRSIQKRKSVFNHKRVTKLFAGKEIDILSHNYLEKEKQYEVYAAAPNVFSHDSVLQAQGDGDKALEMINSLNISEDGCKEHENFGCKDGMSTDYSSS